MDDRQPFQPREKVPTWTMDPASSVDDSSLDSVTYLKQIYSLLTSSLLVACAAGYVGMSLPFAYEHPILLIVLEFMALFLALAMRNAVTLFLFTGISGLTIGPVIAFYIGAGLSAVVGQAAFLTAVTFGGMTVYALTTKRDFSMFGGLLFAGLIVLLVGGLINLFIGSTAFAFALSAIGTMIFSAYILFETQQYRMNPWAIPPAVAALSMYLNILNLFLSLLRLLSILSGRD